MSQYMLLLHAETVDEAEQAAREAELPLFAELHKSLREAGLLVGSSRCARSRARPRSACATTRPRSSTARSR